MKRIITQVITLFLVMTAMIGGGSTASATTVVSIGDLTCDDGGTVTVEIMLSDVQNYGTGTIDITYNPSVVHVTGVADNSNSAVIAHNADNAAGITSISAWNTGGVSGDVVFASVTFEAVGTGSTPLGIDVVKMRDTSMTTPIPVTVDNGSITIGGTEPPTSFVITGHVSDSDGSPCNGAWVQITNTNTSVSWDAENSSTSNYYRLAISSDDVSEGDVLQFDASGCSQTKTTGHTVTQDEICAGGFDLNIMLEGSVVFEPTITSCNDTGAEKNEFYPGDSVFVKGTGLVPETEYTLWIQNDPVNGGDTLNSTEDPSGSQETVTTGADGSFEPVGIWSDISAGSLKNYDIVVDDQDGAYNAASDGIDSANVAGIVAPVPELASIALFAVGLVMLLGLMRSRRSD